MNVRSTRVGINHLKKNCLLIMFVDVLSQYNCMRRRLLLSYTSALIVEGTKNGSLLFSSVISMVTVLVPVCCGRPLSLASTYKINNKKLSEPAHIPNAPHKEYNMGSM